MLHKDLMKKTLFLLSIILILAIGQPAFAKGNVALMIGYDTANTTVPISGVVIGLSADIYASDNFSLSGALTASALFSTNSSYTTKLSAKYDLLKKPNLVIGLKAGVISSITFHRNILFLGPGIYATLSITPDIDIYADILLPLGPLDTYNMNLDLDFYNYDVTIGALYSLSSRFSLGLEFVISNCNSIIPTGWRQTDFSFGAKVKYSF